MIYDKELKQVVRKLNKLHHKGNLKEKNIYIFGVSDTSRQIINILRGIGVDPIAVLDNDKLKQGSYCARIPVISPNNIDNASDDNNIYIIYSVFWHEIEEQICSLGVSRTKIVTLIRKSTTLIKKMYEAYKGRKIYKRIIKKNNPEIVFLCPYTGTGDIYLIGAFWKEYCNFNNINKYTFLVVSSACKKVAQLCNIKNIIVLDCITEADCIIRAHMLWPEQIKIKILNDSWRMIHTNPIEWFRGFKNLEFTPMFRQFVFDLPNNSVPQHPEFRNFDNDIDKIMKENKLIPGKTVVLSPYSNTLADIADDFWLKLTKRLLDNGYTVCTNCNGKTESPVEGSVPVFFPLIIAPQFIEHSGIFIGVRSGFCDIISAAKAKKVILYDKSNRFYMGSAFEYFNLKDMQLSDDAIEFNLDFNEYNLDVEIEAVIKSIL